MEALRKWTVRNPIKVSNEKPVAKHPQFPLKRERNFNTRQEDRVVRPKACVYCDGNDPLIVRNWHEQSIERNCLVQNNYVSIALALIIKHRNVDHERHAKYVIAATIHLR